MKKLNELKAFEIENSNEMKGGAIKTFETSTSTGGKYHADNWYLFKKNNPSADNPVTDTVETSHTDYL